MKAILNLRKSVIYVAAFAAMFAMASCGDDDDDKKPVELKVTDVQGDFTGNIVAKEKARATGGTQATSPEIVMKVDATKISTDSIPLIDFITVIEGAETAATLVKEISAVKFEAKYTATLNDAKDKINLVVTEPTPLTFTYTITTGEGEEAEEVEKEIEITLAPVANSNVYSADESLTVLLTSEEIKVNETALADYKKQDVTISLKKK